MKILMVSSFLPYPLVNGGNIRLYNLIKQLSKKHEITLVCERRSFQKDQDVEEIKKYCKKVLTVRRKRQWSLVNILKTAFSLSPFLIVGHTSSLMKDKINKELKNQQFDLIHVETFYVLQNVPKTNIPIVLAEHNIEYEVYQKYIERVNFLLKPLLSWDTAKLKRSEKKSWKRVTKIICVSKEDKKVVDKNLPAPSRDIYTKDKVSVVPNGVDEKIFSPVENTNSEKRILFIGDFKWIANRENAKWILGEIWPRIYSQAHADVKLWIVGKEIPQSIRKLWSSNVIFDENVKDAYEIYEKSYILLAPIRVGGGTSFKILEAMASGVPVVTTSLGAKGITAGKEMIKANSTDDLVREVVNLLQNRKRWEKNRKNSRKFIEENFTWGKIVKKLNDVYLEVLK